MNKKVPSMESLIAEFFTFLPKLSKVSFWVAGKNSPLIGDISAVFFKFTKFSGANVSRGGNKAFFYISHDHMIDESRDLLDEIPSQRLS